MTRHLDVLAEAGLIMGTEAARTVTVRMRAKPVREALQGLARYQRFWGESLDRLAAHAGREERAARRRAR